MKKTGKHAPDYHSSVTLSLLGLFLLALGQIPQYKVFIGIGIALWILVAVWHILHDLTAAIRKWLAARNQKPMN